jgi:hypothetical protein
MVNNEFISKATDMEKIDGSVVAEIKSYLEGKNVPISFSGVTVNSLVETSSLMGGGRELSQPNFITDCFFLVHVLISFISSKAEKWYMKNNENLNKSIEEKNYQAFDEIMAEKICVDAHIFGKNTIALYRSLFSFTHCLNICAGDQVSVNEDLFKTVYGFLDKGVQPCRDANTLKPLSTDFRALP